MKKTLSKKEKLSNISYLLNLLSSGVNKTSLTLPADVDFEFIFNFAKLHNVENVVFYAIENKGYPIEDNLYRHWKELKAKNLHKTLIQEMEINEISNAFKKNNIEFLSFKGFWLSKFYPAIDYRSMTDLDFLIKDDFKGAKTVLESLGYTHSKTPNSEELIFEKQPFSVVELHRDLIDIYTPFYKYYKDIFKRCKKENSQYFLTDEDEYIYTFVHLYKHFSLAGCGIRNILDIYLLNKKLLPSLSETYIENEFKKLNLTSFHKEISQIAEKWFSGKAIENFTKNELYILSSGAYGTEQNIKDNDKKGKSKIAYVFSRIFPPLKRMQFFYRPLIKYPFLLPVFYVYRWIKRLL